MWKQLVLSALVAVSAIAVSVDGAEARRLGGGRSMGMQRSTIQPRQAMPPARPQQFGPAAVRPATPMPPGQQSGWRRWAAPLAGLAAGLGLAALMSHMGLGPEFGNMLLLILAAIVAFALIRRLFGNKARQPEYANGNAGMYGRGPYEGEPMQLDTFRNAAGQTQAHASATNSLATVPAGFDVEGFVHQAKVNFIRLQAAHDSCNLDDIREFTTPEMFAEIKLAIDERGRTSQQTDVMVLNAELLAVAEEGTRYIASVRYHGTLREEAGAAPETIDEVWHLSKSVDGNRGWTLAGIQQVA